MTYQSERGYFIHYSHIIVVHDRLLTTVEIFSYSMLYNVKCMRIMTCMVRGRLYKKKFIAQNIFSLNNLQYNRAY